jgi:hypothetical protein
MQLLSVMLGYSREAEEEEKCAADDDCEGYPATPAVPFGIGAVAIVAGACQIGPLDRWFKENLPVGPWKKDSHVGFLECERGGLDVEGRWKEKKQADQSQSG